MSLTKKLRILSRRYLTRVRSRGLRRRFDIVSVPPCYQVLNRLTANSVVVDCGTGADPNLSLGLIQRFGVRAVGLEPTRKHHAALERVKTETHSRFSYYPVALAPATGDLTFHESQSNISGSLFSDHVNVQRDETLTYSVRGVTLDGLCDLVGVNRIDLLKLDIEGAEYEALANVSDASLSRIDQLIVEFHDHCVDRFTPADTARVIRRLESAGFTSYATDGIDFLFFRGEPRRP